MAPRSTWKGYIKLSLVSVPVKAYTAHNTAEEIRLNQLHKDCHSRVRYKKVCPEHGELESKEIISGYEYAKGNYVVIDPKELNKLRTESDHSIHIDGFVEPEEIDPLYLSGKTYYLMPDGAAGHRPYALLEEGMHRNGVVAMAQVVISGREQLVCLRPAEGLIQMSVLHYAKKVRAPEEFGGDLDELEMTSEELKLADTLIAASRIDEFDLESYRDTYVEKLSKVIQLKVDGEEVVQSPDPEEPKIINLMEALKKSVADAKASSRKKMAPSKKKAASRSRKKKTGS